MHAVVDPTMQSDYHFETLARIRHFISQTSGYQLTTMGEFQLLLGIVIGFQMIVRFGPDKIRRTLGIIEKAKTADPKGHWRSDLNDIQQDFFKDMIYKVDRILLRFDDVIAYCHSVTVEQFNIHFGDDLDSSILKEMAVWSQSGIIDMGLIKTRELEDRKEMERMMAERDRVDQARKREIDEAKDHAAGSMLVNFDEIDKKIESMFGLKMGEFMKEDQDILGKSVGGQSSIRRRPESIKDDTTYHNIADDLKSRRGGKSQKSDQNSKLSGTKKSQKGSKEGEVSRRTGKTSSKGAIEEGDEEIESSRQSKSKGASGQASKRSKFSQPKKESKSKIKGPTSKRSDF